jgi:hypothetical protein
MKNSKIQAYNIWTRLLISFVITGILLPIFTLFLSTSSLAATANIQKSYGNNQTVIKSYHSQKSPSSILAEELAEEEDTEEEEFERAFDVLKTTLSYYYGSKNGDFNNTSSPYLTDEKICTQEPPYILFCSLKIPS